MEWYLDAYGAKSISIFFVTVLYLISFIKKNLGWINFILALLSLLNLIPLGHDTLNYIQIYQSNDIRRYGPIFIVFGLFADFFDSWIVFYVFTCILITSSFYLLSLKSTYPSLFFTMLITLPGIGQDFSSIMRQGLATSFLYFSYLLITSNRRLLGISSILLSVLAHATSIFPIAIIFGRNLFRIVSHNKLLSFILAFSPIYLILFVPVIFDFMIETYIPYLVENYILSRDDAPQAGRLLLSFWIFIFIFPYLIYISLGVKFNASYFYQKISFLALYIFLYIITPPMARLAWYVLPLILLKHFIEISSNVCSKIIYGLLILTCFSVALYGIIYAPTYFWLGYYE